MDYQEWRGERAAELQLRKHRTLSAHYTLYRSEKTILGTLCLYHHVIILTMIIVTMCHIVPCSAFPGPIICGSASVVRPLSPQEALLSHC